MSDPSPTLSSIAFHVGPYTYTLIVSETRMYDPEGNEMEGAAVEGRRLLILSPIVEIERREEVAFHEYWHAWEFSIPKPQDNEERAQLAAFISEQFRKDLDAGGGEEAIRAMLPTRIGNIGTGGLAKISVVAKRLSVSSVTVRRMIKAGEIAAHKVRRSYRVECEELERFIAANRVNVVTMTPELQEREALSPG